MVIDPQIGYSMNTRFNISLSNFYSDYPPITYEVYCTIPTLPGIELNLTNTSLPIDQHFISRLPELNSIIVKVIDAKLTQITITKDIYVLPSDDTNNEDPFYEMSMDEDTNSVYQYFLNLEK